VCFALGVAALALAYRTSILAAAALLVMIAVLADHGPVGSVLSAIAGFASVFIVAATGRRPAEKRT
jgi:hypothetical protein